MKNLNFFFLPGVDFALEDIPENWDGRDLIDVLVAEGRTKAASQVREFFESRCPVCSRKKLELNREHQDRLSDLYKRHAEAMAELAEAHARGEHGAAVALENERGGQMAQKFERPICGEIRATQHQRGTFGDVEKLAQKQPIVHALMELHLRGKISREQLLISCVLWLAEVSEELIQELIDERGKSNPCIRLKER